MSVPPIAIDPLDAESSPAMSPSSVDLPLPDGPMMARHRAVGDIEIEGMKNGQRLPAAHDGLADAAKLDHEGLGLRA